MRRSLSVCADKQCRWRLDKVIYLWYELNFYCNVSDEMISPKSEAENTMQNTMANNNNNNWGKWGKHKGKKSLPLLWPRVHVSWVRLRVCWLICWFLGSANQKFKPRGRSRKRGVVGGGRSYSVQVQWNKVQQGKQKIDSRQQQSAAIKCQSQSQFRLPFTTFPKCLEASTSGVRSRVLRGVPREWRTIMQQNPLEALPEPALPSDSNDASNDIVKSEACAAVPSQRSRRLDRRR